MAYYDALIAKWAQAPAGTEQQKLDWVNAQTVTGAAIPMVVSYSEIYNRTDRAEYNALTTAQEQSVQRILGSQPTIDFGPNSEARRQYLTLFPAGSKTQQNLKSYTDLFDVPKIPWATATLAQGGGGLRSSVSHNDLVAAGIV